MRESEPQEAAAEKLLIVDDPACVDVAVCVDVPVCEAIAAATVVVAAAIAKSDSLNQRGIDCVR